MKTFVEWKQNRIQSSDKMATEWDEVKRLAADFQRAQLSASAQKLSERNCIEIINKLVQSKLLNVLYTVDGKEYVTPQHLLQEIKDELFVQGGRMHLSELARTLNVDYSHVDSKARELISTDDNVNFILGQLIDRSYVDSLFEEINEKLQQQGQLRLGELAVHYDLPPDFMQKMLEQRLGTTVQGHVDPFDAQVVLTEAFVARHKARILGALTATTKPTHVSAIISRYGLQERLFFAILQELLASKQLLGSLSGAKREKTAVYIPDVYAKVQNEWVDSFYRQNQYLEFDAMTRLGITDPTAFIRQRLPDETLIQLQSCAVGPIILDQIEAGIEDAVTSGSWVDVESLCPSFFTDRDVKRILQIVQQNQPKRFADTTTFERPVVIVASNKFVQAASLPFEAIMQSKAEEASLNGMAWTIDGKPVVGGDRIEAEGQRGDRKDERRKKAQGGKSGGGTQGRETRTKATKKKYGKAGRGGGNSDDSDNDDDNGGGGGGRPGSLPFLTLVEIEAELLRLPLFEECPDGFATQVARHLREPLTSKFQEVTRNVFLSKSASNATLRKSHGEVQEKVNGLVTNINFFVKGAELFADDVKLALHKYLLKTVCSDTVNLVLSYVAQENNVPLEHEVSVTPELRLKIIAKLPERCRDTLSKLNVSLNGKSVEGFLKYLDDVMGQGICDMVIKKLDKKKERQYIFNQRHALLDQLTDDLEPAMALHLAALVLFHTCTGCMLHASGKFVPHVVTLLATHLPSDLQQLLHNYQVLVVDLLTHSSDAERQRDIRQQLELSTPALVHNARNYKKGGASVVPLASDSGTGAEKDDS